LLQYASLKIEDYVPVSPQVFKAAENKYKRLQKGDLATIVDYHKSSNYDDGFSLGYLNALGKKIAIVTVTESSICSFIEDKVFNIRHLKAEYF
jgi:hypothetical protein